MGSWDDLPRDILELIMEKMDHGELLCFGCVCIPWRSIYLQRYHSLPKKLPLSLCLPRPFGVPLLLRSCKEGADTREFICLGDEAAYGEFVLPYLVNKWICGSSHGWLVTTDVHSQGVNLVNPITGSKIDLPSVGTFTKCVQLLFGRLDAADTDFMYINKAIVTTDPTTSPSDCMIMTICGCLGVLSYCKVRDNKWTNVEGSPYTVEDVIYHEGRFYAVNQNGVVLSFDGADPSSEVIYEAKPPTQTRGYPDRTYLVVSLGEILQVVRIVEGENVEEEVTVRFDVFKLTKRESPSEDSTPISHTLRGVLRPNEVWHEWVKVEHLGDQILFLGNNGSFSLSVHQCRNCKGNRIYFTDDNVDCRNTNALVSETKPVLVYHNIGIYDLEDERVHPYHPNDPHDIMPSVWVTPNPW